MIVEWLVSLATGLWSFIAGLFPDWTLPAEIASPDGVLSQIFGYASGLGVWADWAFVGTVAAIPLGIWATGLLVKAILLLISHIPFFGGSTG